MARRFRSRNAWADERIATAAATFPVDAVPLEIGSGGVPGFRLRNAYVLPGVPAEMRSMFRALTLPVEREPIHRTVITVGSSGRPPAGASQARAAMTSACVSTSRVGWMTGAKAGLWLDGMSAATRPAAAASR